MPTRTYLTTPPGREPSQALGRSASEPQERYVPALAAPTEPTPPSRWRTPLLVALAVVVLAAVVVTAFRLSAATQAQDPALDPGVIPAPGDAEPATTDGDAAASLRDRLTDRTTDR